MDDCDFRMSGVFNEFFDQWIHGFLPMEIWSFTLTVPTLGVVQLSIRGCVGESGIQVSFYSFSFMQAHQYGVGAMSPIRHLVKATGHAAVNCGLSLSRGGSMGPLTPLPNAWYVITLYSQ